MITRENYEIWLVDLAEGHLTAQQAQEVQLFLQQNPDLQEEYEAFQQMSLPIATETYAAKEVLKQPISRAKVIPLWIKVTSAAAILFLAILWWPAQETDSTIPGVSSPTASSNNVTEDAIDSDSGITINPIVEPSMNPLAIDDSNTSKDVAPVLVDNTPEPVRRINQTKVAKKEEFLRERQIVTHMASQTATLQRAGLDQPSVTFLEDYSIQYTPQVVVEEMPKKKGFDKLLARINEKIPPIRLPKVTLNKVKNENNTFYALGIETPNYKIVGVFPPNRNQNN